MHFGAAEGHHRGFANNAYTPPTSSDASGMLQRVHLWLASLQHRIGQLSSKSSDVIRVYSIALASAQDRPV